MCENIPKVKILEVFCDFKKVYEIIETWLKSPECVRILENGRSFSCNKEAKSVAVNLEGNADVNYVS